MSGHVLLNSQIIHFLYPNKIRNFLLQKKTFNFEKIVIWTYLLQTTMFICLFNSFVDFPFSFFSGKTLFLYLMNSLFIQLSDKTRGIKFPQKLYESLIRQKSNVISMNFCFVGKVFCFELTFILIFPYLKELQTFGWFIASYNANNRKQINCMSSPDFMIFSI